MVGPNYVGWEYENAEQREWRGNASKCGSGAGCDVDWGGLCGIRTCN
jgi:hypothetical protein